MAKTVCDPLSFSLQSCVFQQPAKVKCRSVLVAGVSTRAAAESAARAGFAVTAIDAFGDLDQHASVRALSLGRSFHRARGGARRPEHRVRRGRVPLELRESSRRPSARSPRGGRCGGTRLRCSDACAIRCWSRRRSAAGAAPCPRCTSRRSAPCPIRTSRPALSVKSASPDVNAAAARGQAGAERWLVKPLASGGGHRVRPWRWRREPAARLLPAGVRRWDARFGGVRRGRRARGADRRVTPAGRRARLRGGGIPVLREHPCRGRRRGAMRRSWTRRARSPARWPRNSALSASTASTSSPATVFRTPSK